MQDADQHFDCPACVALSLFFLQHSHQLCDVVLVFHTFLLKFLLLVDALAVSAVIS